jgi:hypothetical protein
VPASPPAVQRAALEELPATASPAIIPAAAAQPPAAPPPADPQARLREMYRLAAERYDTIDSYIARMRRREQVNGKDRPEELLLFKFRKEPWSVYFKFLGPEGKGREVVYVKGQYGNQIHTLLAAGDMPLAPAGKRMALAPDSLFVRAASRHSITEAGIGDIIRRFGRLLDALEKGDTHFGTVRYLGPVKRPEYEAPLEAAEVTLPPGLDAALPRGGKRLVMFDPASRLPVLVITQDDTGHEVEYYCYDRLESPVRLDADDFNPDKLWPAR